MPTPYGMPSFFVYASLEGETPAGAAFSVLSFVFYAYSCFVVANRTASRLEEFPLSSHAFHIHISSFALSRMARSGILRITSVIADRSCAYSDWNDVAAEPSISRIVELPEVR